MKRKRTKDQQIKHLKAMIGGYARALMEYRLMLREGTEDNPRWERKYEELVARLSPEERQRLAREDLRRISYKAGAANWENVLPLRLGKRICREDMR